MGELNAHFQSFLLYNSKLHLCIQIIFKHLRSHQNILEHTLTCHNRFKHLKTHQTNLKNTLQLKNQLKCNKSHSQKHKLLTQMTQQSHKHK
ncbi:hypothetical protein VIGAN_06113600 [Vigna angularis var. angularis]|uniref:Uncharacterized protein n=1 Tax=Vigna angularis var. angularis TaxID=157739 RepID=A0A0S3SB13_PHAAN|nr:hypothetical protein VIGAN_06113600 [Vigna angularis var. angularis]